jgi:hypothetical protein
MGRTAGAAEVHTATASSSRAREVESPPASSEPVAASHRPKERPSGTTARALCRHGMLREFDRNDKRPWAVADGVPTDRRCAT